MKRVCSSGSIAPVGESTVVGRPTRVASVAVDPDVRSALVDECDVVPEVPALGSGAPLPEPPAPPRLRLGPPPATDRLRGWIVTLTLTLIAGVVRFVGLDRPTDGGTPVFDEKHYVPQAWQMLRNGGVEDNPGYELIVHPPLGKQLIAVGEWMLGYNGWGWRAASALATSAGSPSTGYGAALRHSARYESVSRAPAFMAARSMAMEKA